MKLVRLLFLASPVIVCAVLVLLRERATSPAAALDFPVDLDGNGLSTQGDKAVFNEWLAMGGSLDYALSNGQAQGDVIDLSAFFRSPLAALSPDSQLAKGGGTGIGSASSPTTGAGPLAGCPQPADSVYFTRRLPPGVSSPNNASLDARTTPDGQFIVFSSNADLGFGPPPGGARQVYRFERSTGGNGLLVLVSRDTSGNMATFYCNDPSISDDGNKVVFSTVAQLTAETTSGHENIYLRDIAAGTTRLLSKSTGGNGGNSDSRYASISGDGAFVGFASLASDLVSGDTNGRSDVFRVASDATGMTRISVSDNTGNPQSNADCNTTFLSGGVAVRGVGNVISTDGKLIVFEGAPSNWTFSGLGANAKEQLFVRDLRGGTPRTYLVSRKGTSTRGNNDSRRGSISNDNSGIWIAYSSLATNLTAVAPTSENVLFINVASVVTGTNTPNHSQVLGTGGAVPNNVCHSPMVVRTQGAGAVVNRLAFASDATNLGPGDTNGVTDIYLYDSGSITFTRLLSLSSTGVQANGASGNPDVSADGNHVAYHSDATNLTSSDTNGFRDVFESLRPQAKFIRGDADLNGTVQSADSTLIQNWILNGGSTPRNLDAADANDDAVIDISDPVTISDYLSGGAPLPCPFSSPQPSCCGKDPAKGTPSVGDALTSVDPSALCNGDCN